MQPLHKNAIERGASEIKKEFVTGLSGGATDGFDGDSMLISDTTGANRAGILTGGSAVAYRGEFVLYSIPSTAVAQGSYVPLNIKAQAASNTYGEIYDYHNAVYDEALGHTIYECLFEQYDGGFTVGPSAADRIVQLQYNELYSELLKSYLRFLPGVDPREASFSCWQPFVSTLNSSEGSVYTDAYTNSETLSEVSPTSGTTLGDIMKLNTLGTARTYGGKDYTNIVEVSKAILKSKMLSHISAASPNISSKNLTTMAVDALGSIIYGAEKYRDQMLTPSVF